MPLLKQRDYTVQRSPTLNTVLMVEETLQTIDGVTTIAALKKELPKQVMHQTLVIILDYLAFSGKITMHDNELLWTWKPESVLQKKSTTRVR
ncbi:MAG: hypothetical protein OXR66_08340 [Candidatus Woesearchaeota archaeon]|nr:hypothetical protein [Candidatus Woesearchaeota archaeon]